MGMKRVRRKDTTTPAPIPVKPPPRKKPPKVVPVPPAEAATVEPKRTGDITFLPPAPLPITRDTPFRASGDVPFAVWEREFERAESPLSDADVRACWETAQGISALVLDRFRVESWYGTTSVARNNVLGLRDRSGALSFESFSTPADCVHELVRRWTDASYKHGVYMPRDLSIAGMMAKYSPPHENDTEALIRGCVERLNQWRSAGGTGTTAAPSPDPWRPYPYPKMVDLIVQKPAEGAGFDRVPFRRPNIRGFATHITAGSGSIEWLAAFFSTGGERAWDALTDTSIGRDGRIGLMNDWRDPNRGGTRAGWANGGVDGLEGDGVAFYRAFPNINVALVSCEHVAREGEAWTDAMLASTIELRTAIAQELKCPWDAYPYHPKFGGVSIEQQHRNFATKSCPANPYISQYDAVVKREVKAMLKAWQGGITTGPVPEPEPVWYTRFGFNLEDIESFFGTITRHNLDGTTDELPFSPTGALSLLWLNRCDAEGKFPEAERIWYSDAKFVEGKEMWASWVGGWMAFLPLADSRASWQWLDSID